MTRLKIHTDLVARLRREAGVLLKLSPWLLAGLLFAALAWHSDSSATGGLFQSDQATPWVTPTSPALLPTSGLPTLTPSPDLTAVPTAALTGTVPTAPLTGTLPTVAVPESTLLPPAASATPPAAPLAPTPTVRADRPPATPESQRYPEQDADLKYDWGMLFDSLALGLSYLWLVCGVLLFFGVVALLLGLWVRNRRRN